MLPAVRTITISNEGCEGYGAACGLSQPRVELAERSREPEASAISIPIWAGIVGGAKLF